MHCHYADYHWIDFINMLFVSDKEFHSLLAYQHLWPQVRGCTVENIAQTFETASLQFAATVKFVFCTFHHIAMCAFHSF